MTANWGGWGPRIEDDRRQQEEIEESNFYNTALEPLNYTGEKLKHLGVKIERSFTFGIDEIKSLIIDYLYEEEGIAVKPKDISVSIKEAKSFSPVDYQQEQANFTATVKK